MRGDNVPESEVLRRPGKEPMVPDETSEQGYTEGGDEEGYYENDYYPTNAERE